MGYKNYEQQKAAHASMAEKKKSPAKLGFSRKTKEDVRNPQRPEGDGLKRVTESGQRQKQMLSYIDKERKQMEDYKKKKQEAEFAHKAKMTEKQMYGGKQYVHEPRGGMASPFKLKPKSPLMSKISASCKARAKKKFKVWPSAYASGWGVRCTQGKV